MIEGNGQGKGVKSKEALKYALVESALTPLRHHRRAHLGLQWWSIMTLHQKKSPIKWPL